VGRQKSQVKLRIVLEPSDEGGYTALVPALPGCISEGVNREEALGNIQKAIRLYLEPVDDDLQARSDSKDEFLELT
jgi:predicted RNase H-like HicB family nuclease